MTRTTALALLAALALVACKHEPPAPPPPPTTGTTVRPGFAVSLLALMQGALGCVDETLTWAVTEPNGGTVTQAGVYTAPSCGSTFTAGIYHVTAAGCSRTASIAVEVAEALTSVEVVCAVVGGTTCCKRSPIQIAPGGTAQFYARVNYTCHSEFDPAGIPTLCP